MAEETYKIFDNIVGLRDMTDEEKSIRDAELKDWKDQSLNRKLLQIKEIRLQKLEETDWKVTSAKEQGTNLSTSFKNWRQGLRDIPSTYTTESEYDELLARDEDGNLTHSVWSE
tara:strand:+ start:462 stop:803 length:342 start_codon:yes stop_codon:yes gene_type:complete